MTYSPEDVNCLAYCGWMEARGDGLFPCFAVMCVIYNRVLAPDFPKTVNAVVYQRDAFSWTIPGNPEYGLQPAHGDPIYTACLADAPTILCGTNDDPTKGALFYANEAVTGPGWYRTHIIENPTHPILVVIGHHTFRK